jgi:hypothetical protein
MSHGTARAHAVAFRASSACHTPTLSTSSFRLAASDAGWCCCKKARASKASALQPVALKRPETGGSERECTTRRLRGVDGVSGAPPASGLPEPAVSA